jgi:hypothetical protein
MATSVEEFFLDLAETFARAEMTLSLIKAKAYFRHYFWSKFLLEN